MTEINSGKEEFISRVTRITEENLSNEQFGVSELARETGMSRSNLLRKIKKMTGLSVSLFIRQVRLKYAKELLEENDYTVSEVSYKTGFSSVSYFIKCYHDLYGYPPGKTGKRESEKKEDEAGPRRKSRDMLLWTAVFVILLAIVSYLIIIPLGAKRQAAEKSIAVLPFKNDSNDSTNVYIINGLMESILNNLQKIGDLRVISRTSVEKFRNTSKTIPEIAKELGVIYLVEGSGQKTGDQILLHIQLIDGGTDRQMWAEQYARATNDIFQLQQEVARKIAGEVEVIISPEAAARIDQVPTNDLEAYDLFLKGRDLLKSRKQEDLEQAVVYFKQAVDKDHTYARAYAAIAMAYYYMDQYRAGKIYSEEINYYADKALLFDSELAQSLIAKALYYMSNSEYELAASYLEKALKYNPNNDLVFAFLVELYSNFYPDAPKYLEYALKGIKLNLGSYDSLTASYSYLHISNAFIQTGFVKEARKYIHRSLDYDPDNLYSQYVKAYIDYATGDNLSQLKDQLLNVLTKDTTRLDILQEVGKACYFLRDYKSAYAYYSKFMAITNTFHLDVYRSEKLKIGLVFSEMGQADEAKRLFADFKAMADNDPSIYKHMNLAAYYSYTGDLPKAIEHLRQFSLQEDYFYWILLFAKMDPVFDNIRELPEFNDIMSKLERKFRKRHKKIKAALKEEHVI